MKLSNKILPKLRYNQSGQAAIFITLILIMVMAIIAVGINQVLNRSLRQSLNYQQGIQANYAAESGVNDAIAALNHGAITPASTTNCSTFTSLNPTPPASTYISPSLSPAPKVAYTCLSVSGTPATLQYNVDPNESQIAHIQPSPTTNKLTFSWTKDGSANPVSNCTSGLQFVPPTKWTCPYPVLRLDLFDDVNGAGTYNNAAALEANTMSFFLFPNASGSGTASINFNGTPPQPQVLQADCHTSSTACSETFTISDSIPGHNFTDGYARLTTYYDYSYTGAVTISSPSPLTFINSQLQIDSTGIDQDEIQRIEVRVPYSSTQPTAPNYAIGAAVYLCKRYTLSGSGSSPENTNSNSVNYDAGFGNGNNTSLCGNALKPAIYLYPTHDELVNVKVAYPTGLKTTIPAYDPLNGWSVLAQPSGSLTNTADGQNYPYLYWEGNLYNFNFDMSQGFVVSGKDTASFLKHELAVIGLNKNEIDGFLQYWVPKMKDNPYSLIHFAGKEYTNIAPLNVSPKPDSVLRVFMAEEPLSQPVKVTPQHFTTFKRSGFTVVEWGGSVLSTTSTTN